MRHRVSWVRTVVYSGSEIVDFPEGTDDEGILNIIDTEDLEFFESIEGVDVEIVDSYPLADDEEE